MDYNKTILVSGIESNTGKITLLEQEEGKQYPVKYSFFQNNTNGTPTEQFIQFTTMGVSIGNSYQILVRDVAGTNKMNGNPVTYRNIVKFYDIDGKASPSVPQSVTAAVRATTAGQKQVANEVSANINRFEAGKEANMRRMASGRDAVLLVVAEMGQGSAWSEEDIKVRIKNYAKWMEAEIYGTAFIS